MLYLMFVGYSLPFICRYSIPIYRELNMCYFDNFVKRVGVGKFQGRHGICCRFHAAISTEVPVVWKLITLTVILSNVSKLAARSAHFFNIFAGLFFINVSPIRSLSVSFDNYIVIYIQNKNIVIDTLGP